MKKKILLPLLFICLSVYTYGQDPLNNSQNLRFGKCKDKPLCPKNTFFHETNGNISTLNYNSLNYERIILCDYSYMLGARIGFTYFSFTKLSSYGFPAELNLIIGGRNLMFELGAGVNYLKIYRNYDIIKEEKFKDKVPYWSLTGRIGLRYQRISSIFVRFGFTPIYSLSNHDKLPVLGDSKFIPLFGLAIGYTL